MRVTAENWSYHIIKQGLTTSKKKPKKPYDKKVRVEKVRRKYQTAPFLTVPTRTENNPSKMAGVVNKVVKILHWLYLTWYTPKS